MLKLNAKLFLLSPAFHFYLNTSHVKVKLTHYYLPPSYTLHLNTSHVKVKQVLITTGLKEKNPFKYISC